MGTIYLLKDRYPLLPEHRIGTEDLFEMECGRLVIAHLYQVRQVPAVGQGRVG